MAIQYSGQITVTTAGTEVQGPDTKPFTSSHTGGFYIRALTGNTGLMYVGNDGAGAISSTTGFQLAAGQVIFVPCENLNEIWVDASVNGEKVCWMRA